MGTESTAPPPASADDKSQNPVSSELGKPMDREGQDAKGEGTKETSEKSIFVNSEPMREEQVQNAVKFLSHPKVRGSPVIYRRSFLEKKGLTKEEIDEAFRRVPDPPPNITGAPTASPNSDGQLKSHTSSQPQVPPQAPQPAAILTSTAATSGPTLLQSRFHWSHMLLAVGLLAASSAGTAVLFKNAVVPRLKSWIRKVVTEQDDSEMKENSKPTLAEEAAAAAKAAAVAAADVARTSQELLNSKNEERKYFDALKSLLDVQVAEMKSLGNALHKLETAREVTRSSNKHTEDYVQFPLGNGRSNDTSWKTPLTRQAGPKPSMVTKQAKVNGAMDIEMDSVRPSSAPASMEPAVASHPKSYMEVMAMVQRGEKPPGIKDIDDKPPNPNQPPSNPRLAPIVKPWDAGQVVHSSNYGFPTMRDEGLSSEVQDNGNTQTNGKSLGSKGDSSEPWWRPKTLKFSEMEPTADDQSAFSYGTIANNGLPVQHRWVPPQPPSVVIPEAASAIRQPKSLVQKEHAGDEQSEHPEDGNDVLERIANASETAVEVGSANSMADYNPSERQEERDNSIEVN
ncbi:peroxisomal membrane protein PEX14 isoform X1 [Cinnamomum micranthum f. kanehirae]|uniref:Peroxisomal membrane protein PEX14 n=1 Tax=Cinnamomum micranthum f. kanehirae TaxID=337451 RepID=A0A3S3P8R5_9MAGN|nr:peroxisomal membrane protein PEX14 isoform X1 [Cinnamomum micranthum f. kanehirae]